MPSSAQLQPVLDRIDADFDNSLERLFSLLRIKSISADPAFAADCKAAADHLAKDIASLGLATEIRPTAGHPAIVAKPNGNGKGQGNGGSRPHVLFYGHYDVQPVDPLREWHTPPFRATRIGQNLFARGASDDKGQLFIHLKALESYLSTQGALPINIKVWLEGEEEINSPNLAAFLDREAPRLQADAVLVSDTEMLGRGRPSIIYGLRGNLAFELQVGGPRHDLHAGRYGGAVLNPLQALCEIIAGLHNQDGQISIPGFYQSVRAVNPAERQELRCCAPGNEEIIADLDVPMSWGEPGYSMFERMTIRPALTAIRGLVVSPLFLRKVQHA